jgi:uncharacterized protein (TIGR00369 family)
VSAPSYGASMTDDTFTTTREHALSTRRRLQERIATDIHELGVDPTAHLIADMSGMEYYERWLGDEEVTPPPPIAMVFPMDWLEVEEGRAVASLEPAEWMFNQIGAVHGGISATLLDLTLGAAVHSKLPARTALATTDLHTRYVRPLMAGAGRMIATGFVVHKGRRQATAEGRIVAEESGKLIATATAAYSIFEIPS